MPLIMVAGPAASGKSTLGAALAAELGATVSDLDVVTRDFVDAVIASQAEPDEAAVLARFRDERYALLAEDVRRLGPVPVVAVAPFTRELADPAQWRAWVEQAGWRPDRVATVVIELDVEERYRRMAARGEARDRDQVAAGAVAPMPDPAVPAIVVSGRSPLARQVAEVLQRFGNDHGGSGGDLRPV